MSSSTRHFLITFDRPSGETSVRDVGTSMDEAIALLRDAERAADGADAEVVLLSADSFATLKRTHSSYFGTNGSPPGIPGRAA